MRKTVTAIVVLIIMSSGMLHGQTFTLKSNELNGQFTSKQYGNDFGCNGGNISPDLVWENAPKDTKAFAITMYDKDAPTGSGFWHWVVYNIPATTMELKSDAGNYSQKSLPQGAVNGNNDAGTPGYVGACPPPGPAHMYVITVYALKSKLEIDKNASAALIGFMLNANTIAKASIIAYGQQ
ncbi:YbhB/YbcL family Raf kinase inhibitor-like protein [Solitalea canadensis]|uniref:Raf kinase inhibitor-like protein, YbhB/YbcL family n=1 Tax=Solitalea canadensis (strain ATCC 29591 / DSM 3403 / JCM 21819 / LMG 8368 / NBRC 15130 / NCIMB 12057 / USAM 9D) TaxID=929556 RepID=H8KM14_SOLCM|nr:YbhB/YbcL family Raf kinase inhibitor-like protein [Solitalea canadensis]AFD08936.1 Raf kinase inhibitor-like protein, YbhB/YbcL family [Solitalea canadensis DSM 3403]